MDRRRFLAQSSAAATTAAILNPARGETAGQTAAARRVVLIGCGWYGKLDLLQLILVEPVEVVGVCDVDAKMADEAAMMCQQRQRSGRRPPTFADYQGMLDATSPDIAVIGTPDHWHALTMIAAVRAGADVYVQKPTAIDTIESKAMLDAAAAAGRVVQVGTQRRSTPHLIEAKEQIVDAGLLGNVAFAEVCCYYHMRTRENPEPIAPPRTWTTPRTSVPPRRCPTTPCCIPRNGGPTPIFPTASSATCASTCSTWFVGNWGSGGRRRSTRPVGS